MSRIRKDRAVILRTYDYSETSTIAALLTREHGKIRCIAKGAKRPGSKFAGALLTGSICDIIFSYRVNRGLQTLSDADPVFCLDTGNQTLERVCIFQAAIEVLNHSLFEGEPGREPFDLIEDFSFSLDGAADPFALFFAFEIRLLRLIGYFPDIYRCSLCGADLRAKPFRLDIQTGEVSCSGCGGKTPPVSRQAAAKIYNIDVEKLGEILNIELTERERSEIGRALHGIFRVHVEGYRVPSALGLLKGVI